MEDVVAGLLDQFERGRISRRHLVQSLAVGVAAISTPALGAEGKSLKTSAVNHISYNVADYHRTRDFYSDLLGMRVSVQGDNGKQCILSFGSTFIVVRNSRQPDSKPNIDHVAYTIENWDKDGITANLKRRGLEVRPEGDNSMHFRDPDGFDVQISSADMKAYP